MHNRSNMSKLDWPLIRPELNVSRYVCDQVSAMFYHGNGWFGVNKVFTVYVWVCAHVHVAFCVCGVWDNMGLVKFAQVYQCDFFEITALNLLKFCQQIFCYIYVCYFLPVFTSCYKTVLCTSGTLLNYFY